jgi:hypothetical protein
MKYSSEFMKTLGYYQYGYYPNGKFDNTINPQYDGKGVKMRCLDHLKDKPVDIDNLIIIGRNLEKFTEGRDAIEAVQAATESMRINVLEPKLNKIKGMYDELWVKTPISVLRDEWLSEQINPVAEAHKFWNAHPELETVTQATTTNSSGSVYQTKRNKGTEYQLYVNYTIDGPKATIKVNFSRKGVGGLTMEELFAKWTEEYPELETTASNAEGEYEIAEIGSVEDTVEFFVEAATYE